MMNKHSQAITVLLVCLLLAACFRHQNESMKVTEGGADSKPGLRNTTSESSKLGQEGSAAQRGVRTGDRYERMQGYTFLVPDKWEVVPPEHFRDVPNRWEAVPYMDILYMVYGDQKNHTKVRFCFQTGPKDKKYIETNPFEQLDGINEKRFEQGMREHLQVDTVNLLENKQMKVNGFDALWLRFTYSSPIEKGDVIMKVLYKDGTAFSVTGTFSSPMYWELQKDITAVLESIRKE
jgi:hypothetical protein